MTSILDIVQQAIATGYLSLRAEDNLWRLIQAGGYGKDELFAFTQLQIATMEGKVVQQAREQFEQQYQVA